MIMDKQPIVNKPLVNLPLDWQNLLKEEIEKPYFSALMRFVQKERTQVTIFPEEEDVFRAFRLTPFAKVKVVILGQDPYIGEGQANGLCFSVHKGVSFPPSLRNIFKELQTDVGIRMPKEGSLEFWAKQGVFLLNTVLTVRAHQVHSHKNKGWEQFTDAVVKKISKQKQHIVFVLWGTPAQAKAKLIDVPPHTIITGAHPSPLSAHRGFFGSRPFSKVNQALKAHNQPEIDWSLLS